MTVGAMNAFPDRHTIDADDLEQEYKMTIRGNNCACVFFTAYNLVNMEELLHRPIRPIDPNFPVNDGVGIVDNQYADVTAVPTFTPIRNIMIARAISEGDFYNGDEIVQKMNTDFSFPTTEDPNNRQNIRTTWNIKEQAWRAALVERVSSDENGSIDISGKLPTVKVSGGTVQPVHTRGDVNLDGIVDIFDVVEILQWLAGLPSILFKDGIVANGNDVGSKAWNNALVRPESITSNKPSIDDATEILKHLAELPNLLDNILELKNEHPKNPKSIWFATENEVYVKVNANLNIDNRMMNVNISSNIAIETQNGRIKGDVDGDGEITESDATIILEYLAEMESFTGIKSIIDTNPDAKWASLITQQSIANDKPSIFDAVEILKYLAGLPSEFDKWHLNTVANQTINFSEYGFILPAYWLRYYDETLNSHGLNIGWVFLNVVRYNPRTGYIYFRKSDESIRATDYLQNNVGKIFDIVSNFVFTAYYPFFTKKKPQLNFNMEVQNELIKCYQDPTLKYSIKYYRFEVFAENGKLLESSSDIYSNRVLWYFRRGESNRTYNGVLTVVTNDDVEIKQTVAITTPTKDNSYINDLTAIFDCKINAVRLLWSYSLSESVDSISFLIERIVGDEYEYVGTVMYNEIDTETRERFIDYTVSGNSHYKYRITCKYDNGVNTVINKTEITANSVSTDNNRYSLHFLELVPYIAPSYSVINNNLVQPYFDNMYNETQFKVVASWFPQLNIKNQSGERQLGKVFEIGYNGKPTTINSKTAYTNFSFDFMMGEFVCDSESRIANIGQQTFNKWKELIDSKRPVLIKDLKGNVLCGEIESSSYSIDNNNHFMPYNISISFKETYDMKNVIILGD